MARSLLSLILLLAFWWSTFTVRSADPLDLWTARAGNITNLLQNIAYGNGTFVAVGYGGSVITSSDGIEWTPRESGTRDSLYTITFGGDLFVAAGNRGTIIVSGDGVNWSGITTGTQNPFFGSAYGNGMYLVVGGSNVLASANGLLWTPRLDPLFPKAFLNAAAFGGGRFAAVGAGGFAVWSDDTFLWRSSDSALGNHFAMTYGDGLFVAVGGGFGGFSEVASSSDGLTWNSLPIFNFSSLVDVTHGNGRFLAIGLFLGFPPPNASEFLFESRDAVDWITRTLPAPVGMYGLAYANSRFYTVGDAGLVLHSESYTPGWLEVLGPPGTNGLELRLNGEIGRSYRLQASSEADGTNWQDLLLFTNPTAPDTIVTDSRAHRFERRFYRLASP